MWVKATERISENVCQLVTPVSSNYLILGDASAIVDASVYAMGASLLAMVEDFIGKEDTLDFILLTHAHFDHVGAIPLIRRRYPEIAVFAAPQTAELLSNDMILEEFYNRNLACCEAMKSEMDCDMEEWKKALTIDRVIGDGDVLDLGEDTEIKLIGAPGHTVDSVVYSVKPDDALIAGETVGMYQGRDRVYNAFMHSYADYVDSLTKLSALDVKILGFPHNGALCGDLISKHFDSAIHLAERFKEDILSRITKGELVEEIVDSLFAEWQAEGVSPEGPFVDEQYACLNAMVRASAAGQEKPKAEEKSA